VHRLSNRRAYSLRETQWPRSFFGMAAANQRRSESLNLSPNPLMARANLDCQSIWFVHGLRGNLIDTWTSGQYLGVEFSCITLH
jgi:hypothetical protein